MIATDGSMRSYRLEAAQSGVRVQAPGLCVRAMVARDSSLIAMAEAGMPLSAAVKDPTSQLWRALREHEIEPCGAPILMDAAVVPPSEPVSAQFMRPDDSTPHVMLEVAHPQADEGLLLMMDDGATPMWFIPQVSEQTHRFLVPAKAMERPECRDKDAAPAKEPGLLGSVASFFSFKRVEELLQGGADKIVQWIGSRVEGRFVEMGLKQIREPRDSKGRSLLFVHGAFSSTQSAFGKLFVDPRYPELEARYEGHVLGFEHATVSRGVMDNATELVKFLPQNVLLDVVCHSRGALVIRAALELPELARECRQKNIRFGKVVFVAGANQGTELARVSHVEILLNIFQALGALVDAGVTTQIAIGTIKGLAHAIAELPGLRDLDPERSRALPTINAPGPTLAEQYIVIRADYDKPRGLLARAADAAVDRIFGGLANDLIVPFAGAAQFDAPPWGPYPLVFSYPKGTATQGVVNHFNFFAQAWVVDLMSKELTGGSGTTLLPA